MIVKDIIKKLELWAPMDLPCGSDNIVVGDEKNCVDKVCVCCIATCDVIKEAKSWGAQMLITHEPTFHESSDNTADLVADKKRKLVEESGITIYRFHDHMHFTKSDKIIEGVIWKLKWQGIFDGVKKFTFDTEKTIEEIEKDIEDNLGLKNVRICGCKNNIVKNISMCVGSWGNEYVINEFKKPEIDAVICGEITEYITCEYVRDASQMGEKMTLFLLGHMGSEKSGMEYACEYLSETIPDVKFKYIDCGEVY